MPQSNVIFGFLAVAFVIFITMRGELRLYFGFLFSTPVAGQNPSGTQAATNAQPAASPAKLSDAIGKVGEFAALVL